MSESKEIDLVWRQISCQRAVQGASFPQGVQDYNFSIGGNMGWVPNRSYFRIALELKGAGGAQPTIADQVAFADSVCGNLYDNVYVRAGGQDVSSIVNYVPQACALKNRLDKSGAWLKTVGAGTQGIEADFQTRVNNTATDVPPAMDGRTQTVNLGTAGHINDYRVQIAAATGAVTGTNTAFVDAGLKIGDGLLVAGVLYTVTTIADNTNMTVTPKPLADVDTGNNATALGVVNENNLQGRNKVYLMWQPPVGIWDRHAPMGSGDYRVQLNPNSYYVTAGVEAGVAGLANPADFDLVVDDVQLFIATVRVAIPATGTETLHMMETQIQSKKITSQTGDNFLDFTVPPSTKALTVWVQSNDAGTNPQVPPSMFKTKDGSDLDLRSIQLTYANVSKPATRWTSEVKDDTDYLKQRYMDTQLYSGRYWSPGGCETYGDFVKRGPIYHMRYSRSGNDRSTHVQLNIQYGNLEAGTNVFLAAHYSRVCEVSVQNGFVTNVVSLSA
jgi:hypothetical protein